MATSGKFPGKRRVSTYSISEGNVVTEVTPFFPPASRTDKEDLPGYATNIQGWPEDSRAEAESEDVSSAMYNKSYIAPSTATTPLLSCIHTNTYGTSTCNCRDVLGPFTEDGRERTTSYAEHCHPTRETSMDKTARRKLIIASVLCVFFMIAEVVGGFLANSLAIATDAAHLLTDFASFMISLFSLWVAARPATKTMSFGWYRAEVIGALTSVLLIWVITGILVYLAIHRVMSGDYEIDATIMLITSGVGVVVNIIMGCSLHQHGHSHGGMAHGHSHEDSKPHNHNHKVESGWQEEEEEDEHAKRKVNINVRAAFIHVIGDFFQSVGVFAAAMIIYYKPDWKIADPVCTFVFSVLVLITTIAILRDALNVLMEGIPKGIDFNAVYNTFLKIDGILRVHNLRIWALSMDKTALSAHLAIGPGINPQTVLKQASRQVRDKFSFFEMTLQVEEFQAEMEECTQCQLPEK